MGRKKTTVANEEHVQRLRAGVQKWNAWRAENPDARPDLKGADLSGADLTRADLTGADLTRAVLRHAHLSGAVLTGANLMFANLSGANLSGANLSGANLSGAHLSGGHLRHAHLSGAVLTGAHLRRADLSGADLSGADLTLADLTRADLSGADLTGADLTRADLTGADLTNLVDCHLWSTNLGNSDLSQIEGLASVQHRGPSPISTETLELTAAGLADAPAGREAEVETFLRGAGVTYHFIDTFRSLIGQPIQFFSAFISYSHSDKAFARRLYNDLQAQGIRCWLDEKDVLPGDRIIEVVNQAIRTTDRVLLCCSLASLTSRWVDDEITMAMDKERDTEADILIPIDLDGYLFDGWQSGNSALVRARAAARFRGWDKNVELYDTQLARVVAALKPRDKSG